MKQLRPSINGFVPYTQNSLPNILNKPRTCKAYTLVPKDLRLFSLLFPAPVVGPVEKEQAINQTGLNNS